MSCVCVADKDNQEVTCVDTCAGNEGQCVPCECEKPEMVQLNAERFVASEWNVKIVGDTENQDATDALGKGNAKVFMGDATPWVISTRPNKRKICVKSVLMDVSCSDGFEARVMSLKPKKVDVASGKIQGGSAWVEQRAEFGGCEANRVKIRVFPSDSTECEPQPRAALRHVKIEYCEL
jgi:hypothetical protein